MWCDVVAMLIIIGLPLALLFGQAIHWRVSFSWRTLIILQLFIGAVIAMGLNVRHDPYQRFHQIGIDSTTKLPWIDRRRIDPKDAIGSEPDIWLTPPLEERSGTTWGLFEWRETWLALALYGALMWSILADRRRVLAARRRTGGGSWRRLRRGRLPKGALPETRKWAGAGNAAGADVAAQGYHAAR